MTARQGENTGIMSPGEVTGLVTTFQDRLTRITTEDIHLLPDLSNQMNHMGKYTSPSLPEAGLYLAPELLGPNGGVSTTVSFTEKRGGRVGREDSHNGVFVGTFVGEASAEVAVKLNTERPIASLGEIAMHQYMDKLGIPTFQPAGVLVDSEGRQSSLMTRFDGPVTTLTTVRWHDMTAEERWLEIDKVIGTMSLLHPQMLFHGDLDFRNVAFRQTGEVVVIDPEHMVSALEVGERAISEIRQEAENQPATNQIIRLLNAEFGRIVDSVSKYIVASLPVHERPQNDGAKFKLMKQRLYLPYRSRIEDIDSPYRRLLLIAHKAMVGGKKLEAQGKAVDVHATVGLGRR